MIFYLFNSTSYPGVLTDGTVGTSADQFYHGYYAIYWHDQVLIKYINDYFFAGSRSGELPRFAQKVMPGTSGSYVKCQQTNLKTIITG
jgi:hypothetical protein